MNITDVKIRKIFWNGEMGRVKAIVSVTFEDELAIHDMKIVQGIERLFVAMPNHRSEDRRYQDIAHPTSAGMRQQIEAAVLSEYEKALAEDPNPSERVGNPGSEGGDRNARSPG